MASKDYSESDGVWRTVGGRRIFIRDGQSLSDAMKKSGKFGKSKKDKKLKEDAKQLDEMSERNKKEEKELIEKYNEIPQEERVNAFVEGKNWKDLVNEKQESSKEKKIEEGKKKLAESYSKEELDREIKSYQKELKELEADYTGVPSQYRAAQTEQYGKRYDEIKNRINELKAEKKARESKVKTLSGENEKDNKGRDVSQKEYDEFRQAYRDGKISQEDYRNDNYNAMKRAQATAYLKQNSNLTDKQAQDYANRLEKQASLKNVKAQQSDIEQASGSKVKEAFETDLFGNGKEHRFILEDGTIVGHTLESFGQKQDDWYVGNRHFENYDAMKKFLSGSEGKSKPQSQKLDIEKATGLKIKDTFETDAFGTGKETRFDLGNNKWISHSTESFGQKEDKWSINELKNGKIEKTNYKSYDDMLKNVNKSGSGDWVRNAFNQYKKDHPGSKMTLADFKRTNKK